MSPLPRDRGGRFEAFAKWVLLPSMLLAMALVVTGMGDPEKLDWRAWFDGPTRGGWHALTLDGKDVRRLNYTLAIAQDRIAGGEDNCNAWGWNGEVDPANGERLITTTLVGCPDGTHDAAYWSLTRPGARITLREAGLLEIRNDGHAGLFERITEEQQRRQAQLEEVRPAAVPAHETPLPPAPPPPPPLTRPGG